MKRCLVFAPHPDDEINMVGCISTQLKEAGYLIDVCFSTNGDSNLKLAVKRWKEAKGVSQVLGFNHIYTLGYPDIFSGDHLFYYTDTNYVSKNGKKETYGLSGFVDYRFEKSGFHHKYNYNNFLLDISDILKELRPELIVCVDLDSHLDHKVLSIAVESCVGTLMKEIDDFRPVILKKFAYLGTWDGPADFFDIIPKATSKRDKNGRKNECAVFPYKWEDRVRFKTPKAVYNKFFWKSKVYQALSFYKTVAGVRKFERIVNLDSCYWYRPYNEALEATIIVSSGDSSYINDFKLFDTDFFDSTESDSISGRFWTPGSNDKKPEVTIRFKEDKKVDFLRVHFANGEKEKSAEFKLYINNVFQSMHSLDGFLYKDVSVKQESVNEIRIEITNVPRGFGIREIEVFSNNISFPWESMPFYPYLDNDVQKWNLHSLYYMLYNVVVIKSKFERFLINVSIKDKRELYNSIIRRIKKCMA